MKDPAFAYPHKFSEISGLTVKQVRELCAKQIIPNERTRRGFRIYVPGAMETLQSRAAAFAGHTVKVKAQTVIPVVRSNRKAASGFLAALDSLKLNNKEA